MANSFLVPEEERGTLKTIGRGLAGFGAGVQGRGSEFLAGIEKRDMRLSIERQQAAAEDLRRAKALLDVGDIAGVRDLASQRVEAINAFGGDPSDTQGILDMANAAIGGEATAIPALRATFDAGLRSAVDAGIIKEQAKPLSAPGRVQADIAAGFLTPEAAAEAGVSLGQQEFESLIANFSEEDKTRARQIKAGIVPRTQTPQIQMIGGVPHKFDRNTGTMVPVTVSGEEVTAETVAASEAAIEQATTFAGKTGAARADALAANRKAIDDARGSIRTISRAISAIDRGAGTGPLESLLPSFKEATIDLENSMNRMGLDVISSVTFGALSKGELDMALATAAPPNLDEGALRDWLSRKSDAQQKLVDYSMEFMRFLDDPNNTLTDWYIGGSERAARGIAAPEGEQSIDDLVNDLLRDQ